MIIFPKGLILTAAAAGLPLTHARIGYENFTRGLSASSVTVSSEAATGPRDAPLRPDTASWWSPSTLPATWEVDFGRMVDIDYVGVLANLGSAHCSIEPETSLDAGVWTAFASGIAPANDRALMFLDDLRSVRRLRFTVDGDTPPRLKVVYAGRALAMQRPIYRGHSPLSLSRVTDYQESVSRGGQLLGRTIRRMGVNTSYSWDHLTASWYREYFDPFVAAARRYPFFIAWRPETFPKEVGYVEVLDDIKPQNSGPRDFMSVAFNAQGVGHE